MIRRRKDTSTGIKQEPFTWLSKSAAYTMLASDRAVAATGDTTITLPAANDTDIAEVYVVVNAGTGTVTVARAGSDTINGGTSLNLATQWNSMALFPDGVSAWYVVGDRT